MFSDTIGNNIPYVYIACYGNRFRLNFHRAVLLKSTPTVEHTRTHTDRRCGTHKKRRRLERKKGGVGGDGLLQRPMTQCGGIGIHISALFTASGRLAKPDSSPWGWHFDSRSNPLLFWIEIYVVLPESNCSVANHQRVVKRNSWKENLICINALYSKSILYWSILFSDFPIRVWFSVVVVCTYVRTVHAHVACVYVVLCLYRLVLFSHYSIR